MPGNDDSRDPLENLLDQQIQPLPPPPGTFELISQRAERRRVRRTLITVATGAAVTACLLVVSTNPALLRLTPPSESGQAAAGASSASAGPSVSKVRNQPNGSGRPATSPPASSSPEGNRSPSGPGRGTGAAARSGPVPPGFAPSSVTFVSPARAWVIGQAGVPGSCYNGSVCTSVAWTSDDGRTWHGEHAPVTSGPDGSSGVSGIRFLDGVNGWAFGPELWATHNGGSDWRAVDTSGQRVTDLETAGTRAYALFASCSGGPGNAFAAGCTSFTLMTSPAGSDAWQPVSAETSNLSAGGTAASATIQLAGNEGYLLGPDGTVYSGPLGGTWSKAGTAPCQPGAPQSGGFPSDALLAAAAPGRLALACAGSSGTPVYTSGDGGANWTAGAPAAGTPASLAASPSGTLVLATTDGVYSLASGASQWRQAAAASGSALPAGGFSYVGMTSGADGAALPADTSLHEIWVTADAGQTWTPRPVS